MTYLRLTRFTIKVGITGNSPAEIKAGVDDHLLKLRLRIALLIPLFA